MSQRTLSTVIEKTCDACGLVEKVEMIEEKTPEQFEQMTRWGTIIREVYDARTGQWHKCIVQICSATCASIGMLKLLAIKAEPEDAPESDIDLESLRAPKERVN
jgi:hypothetical protein